MAGALFFEHSDFWAVTANVIVVLGLVGAIYAAASRGFFAHPWTRRLLPHVEARVVAVEGDVDLLLVAASVENVGSLKVVFQGTGGELPLVTVAWRKNLTADDLVPSIKGVIPEEAAVKTLLPFPPGHRLLSGERVHVEALIPLPRQTSSTQPDAAGAHVVQLFVPRGASVPWRSTLGRPAARRRLWHRRPRQRPSSLLRNWPSIVLDHVPLPHLRANKEKREVGRAVRWAAHNEAVSKQAADRLDRGRSRPRRGWIDVALSVSTGEPSRALGRPAGADAAAAAGAGGGVAAGGGR